MANVVASAPAHRCGTSRRSTGRPPKDRRSGGRACSSHLWRSRPRHQQLPPPHRATGRRRVHRRRCLLADRSARRRAFPDGRAVRRRRWTGPWALSRSARRSCGAATSPWSARSRPRRAGAPKTARSSSIGSGDETGIVLDIIEPQEEARLAVLGCHKLAGAWRRSGADLRHRRGLDRARPGRPGGRRSEDPQLVERALGRRLADRKRGQGRAGGPRPAPGLWPDARARAPSLRQLRFHACRATSRESGCSAPAAR